MLKVLLKKQMAEVFRTFFYNPKKNTARSKRNKILMVALFGFLMIGVIGGSFTFMAIGIGQGLLPVGMGWLYFVLMGGVAITFGTLGCVFSTYSGLYLPKDNDLLLSMPIPVRLIMISRLMNVYLLGALYSGIIMIPTLIVRWAIGGATAAAVICGIVLYLTVTLIVLILSCLLGWLIAKISLRLKNKSFITVLISLGFIGLYYFVYFKAQYMIRDLIKNAAVYGENIRNSANVLYRFGMAGEGDAAAAAIFLGCSVVVLVLVLALMSRGFIRLATASADTKKVRYREKAAKQNSLFTALLKKEFRRFTSSPNYMLNCGLSTLLLPAFGVFLLIKGADTLSAVNKLIASGKMPGCEGILLCTALLLLATMNDMAAPAVSLEGRSLWILQSLPLDPRMILRAKCSMQLLLTGVPMLFAALCGMAAVHAGAVECIMILVTAMLFTLFSALFSTVMGVRGANIEWTNEIVPIKQSGAVAASMFGGWGFVAVFAAPYFLIGHYIGLTAYLAIWAAVYAAAAVFLYRWMKTKGAEALMNL